MNVKRVAIIVSIAASVLSAGCSGREEAATNDGASNSGGESALVGVWCAKIEDGELPGWWPAEFELCGDGAMNDRDDEFAMVYLSWKEDNGRLMFAAVYEGVAVDYIDNMPEKVTMTFGYTLSGPTLTLSGMVMSATASGREVHGSPATVTYTKSADARRPRITVDRNPAIHLQCVNGDCGAVLVKRYYDFTPEERQKLAMPATPLWDARDGWSPRLLCETCRAVMGRMIQCTNPDCLQWRLDPSERLDAPTETTCPHCR